MIIGLLVYEELNRMAVRVFDDAAFVFRVIDVFSSLASHPVLSVPVSCQRLHPHNMSGVAPSLLLSFREAKSPSGMSTTALLVGGRAAS